LDGFEKKSACPVIQSLIQGRDIAHRHVTEARREGAEELVELFLAGGGNHGDSPSVEGTDEGEHLVLVRMFIRAVLPGDLDQAFVGFRPGIAEKRPVESGGLAKLFGQRNGYVREKVVGAVNEVRRLVGDRLDEGRVPVAQGVDPDAGGKIDILLAVLSQRVAPFPFSRMSPVLL
jgi:hypothetical protein